METKQKIDKLIRELFKDDYNNSLHLTKTELEIVNSIACKDTKRLGIITPTQYGKSLSIAIGVILRTFSTPDKFSVIAPTKGKTRIIMDYIIQHCFDSKIILSQLQVEGGQLEKLNRERNKEHITFKRGGSIKILTADAKNSKRLGEALLGYGCNNIVIDDSPLLDDGLYVFAKRMVGGAKDGLIVETGNPIKRNHFYRTMVTNKRYKKVWIDYKVALQEGRYSEDYIEEMREEKFFSSLYECKFPNEGEIDEQGYIDLLTYQDIENAIKQCKIPQDEDLIEQLKAIRYKINSSGRIQIEPKENMGARGIDSPDISDAMSLTFYTDNNRDKVLGCDVASGGNENVFVMRQGNKIEILSRNREKDTMKTADNILDIIKKEFIKPFNTYIDKVGIGKGVVDKLNSGDVSGYVGVNEGEKASTPDYSNKRAEMYWRLRDWILGIETKKEFKEFKVYTSQVATATGLPEVGEY